MCDPITAAAVALTVGGAWQKNQTQNNYIKATNKANNDAYAASRAAREAEQARQDGYTAEAQALFADAAGDKTTAGGYTEEADAKSDDLLTMLASTPAATDGGALLAGQDGASVAVKDSINARISNSAKETSDRIKALADLTGFGGAGAARARRMGDTGDLMSILGGVRRGSLAVGTQEQGIGPATVNPGDTTIGDIMSGTGSLLALGGGAFGGGSPGMTPTPAGGGLTTSTPNLLPPTLGR